MSPQLWTCPKCKGEYLSPLRVVAVSCHKGHSPVAMKTDEDNQKAKAK